jgi:hypothetical protein
LALFTSIAAIVFKGHCTDARKRERYARLLLRSSEVQGHIMQALALLQTISLFKDPKLALPTII